MSKQLAKYSPEQWGLVLADGWEDVSLKNAEIWRVAMRMLGYSKEKIEIFEKKLAEIAGRANLTPKEMRAEVVTLAVYQLLENCVADEICGHVDELRALAHYALYAKFGGIKWVEEWLLNGPLKKLCSARLVYRAFPEGTKTFNRNKTFRHILEERLESGLGRVVMEMYYLPGPGGTRRRAEIEHRSVLYHILGLFEGAGRIMKIHDYQRTSTARWMTVNIHPQIVLNKELPGASLREDRGAVYLDLPGEIAEIPCGEILYLERNLKDDPEKERYLDIENPTRQSTGTSVEAIRFFEDIQTPDRKGNMRPIMRAETFYRWSDNLPNVIEAIYERHRGTDFFDAIFGKSMTRGLKMEAQVSAAQADAALQRRVMRTNAPSALIAQHLSDGSLLPSSTKCGVLVFDLVGSRSRARKEGWDAHQIAAYQGGMTNALFDLAIRAGGYVFKSGGDGGIIIFSSQWPRFRQELHSLANPQSAAKSLLETTNQMHDLAREHGWELRIGASWGEVCWFDASKQTLPGLPPSPYAHLRRRYLEGAGDPIGEAARLEKNAYNGATSITHMLLEVAHGHPIDPHGEDESFGFQNVGSLTLKSGEADIHVWSREATEEHSGAQIIQMEGWETKT